MSSPIESVDKALQALDCLSQAGGDGLQLGALAEALGLKKNSLHRTLAALRHRAFVVQDALSGNYQLGPSLLRLADHFFNESRLRVQFHPILKELCSQLNELCHLGILDGTDIIYMDKVEPEQSIRVWSAIGMRGAAVTTALGRAIIAFSYDDFESFAKRFGQIPQRTPHTLTNPLDVWAEIQIARMRGYAIENQEGQEGVSCVALPILRNGTPLFAISVTAPYDRMSPSRTAQLVAGMRALITPALPSGLSVQFPRDASALGNGQSPHTAI